MARPRKNSADKLNRHLPPVRCTDGEHAIIQSKAARAGLTISEYMRQAAINGTVTVNESRADFALADQLRRIGVNINQQTRRLNMSGKVTPELRSLWVKLETVLDDILQNA